ncbi:hypothetical protein P7C73_g2118, partial [Tremellales sp. Uapishka_1]
MFGFIRSRLHLVHHPLLRQPVISLALTSLALLLLVLVLLSVPGPIKGLYWFSVEAEGSSDGPLSAGVLGWCATNTSNCTYAPLSDNSYLSSMIDVGEALTVRLMLPVACYWMICTTVFWVLLSIATPFGYRIRDLDSITRHLRFALAEAFVLTAVAAMISLFSLFSAGWGLHLRLKRAQASWKEEAVMVRRRSMALSAAGVDINQINGAVDKGGNDRWSQSSRPESYRPSAYSRGSMVKEMDPEETLEAELELAKRNSRQTSMAGVDDSPYAATPQGR